MNRMTLKILSCAVLVAAFCLSVAAAQSQTALPEPVKKTVLKNCAVSGCHQGSYPAMKLNFEPDKLPASVINVPSREKPELKIVDPASPEKSYLLMKIRGDKEIDGKRMPLNGTPLKAAEFKAFQDWIMSLKDRTGDGPGRPDGESQKKSFLKPAFWGTRLINLPTSQPIEKGRFLFRISHRFSEPIGSGYQAFYGLDSSAIILFGFGYGLSDNLGISLGRTNADQEMEAGLHWRILGQNGPADTPFSASLYAGAGLVTRSRPDRSLFASGNISLNLQISLAYQFCDRLSLLLVPCYSTNTTHGDPSNRGTFSLGIGGRWMVLEDISLIAEYMPAISGNKAPADGWGFGLEKKIGGHVFQVFVLNSMGLVADQFVPGGDLKNDVRLGFNIFRTF